MHIKDIKYLRQETGAGIMECKDALSKTGGQVTEALAILQERALQIARKKSSRPALEGIAYAKVFGHRAVLLEVNVETDFVSGNANFVSGVAKIAETIARYQPGDVASLLACPIGTGDLSVKDFGQKMVHTFGENIVIRRFEVLQGDHPIAYMHQNGKYGVILNLAAEGDLEVDSLNRIGSELALQIAALAPQYVSRFDLSEAVAADIRRQIAVAIEQDEGLTHKPSAVRKSIATGRMDKYFRNKCLLEQRYIRDDSLSVQQFLHQASSGKNAQVKVTGFFRYEMAEGLDPDPETDHLEFARQLARQ